MRRTTASLVLAVLVFGTIPGPRAEAQFAGDIFGNAANSGGMRTPRFQPQGNWAKSSR